MNDTDLVKKLIDMLKRCLPYVTSHYERSRVGFGNSARQLMNEIKEILGIK